MMNDIISYVEIKNINTEKHTYTPKIASWSNSEWCCPWIMWLLSLGL